MSQGIPTMWRSLGRDLGIVLLAMAIAVIVRLICLSALETRIVWVTFYPAVMIVALVSGWRMGLLATTGSCLIALYGWPLFGNRPFINDFADYLGVGAFVFNCILISIVADLARRARQRAMQAQAAAEVANQAKSIFLANMSHELRTPLNAVLGFSDILAKDPTITAEQRAKLAVISNSGRHLLSIINAVLDLSKIESGKVEVEPADFDLGQLILDLMVMLRVRAEAKGLTLRLDQSSSFPCFVRTDPGKLRQVLINLIGNAIKFTSHGQVSVKLAVLACAQPGDRQKLLFEIRDTGPGISVEDQVRLFQPFAQVGHNEGTGLGLAIARRFTKLLGGDISLDSTPGQGSTFRFTIAYQCVDPATLSTLPKAQGHITQIDGAAACRILIVEDQLENRLFLRAALAPWGFQLREAEDGLAGVQAVWDWRPHLVLMDRRMPKLNGLEATRQIRAQAAIPQPTIIAVTAHAYLSEREEMLAAGCNAFLAKPFDADQLLAVLAQHLPLQLHRVSPPASGTVPVNMDDMRPVELPADLLSELNQALVSLDARRIKELVHRVEAVDAGYAQAMLRLAEDFDYEAIRRMLGTRGGT